MDENYREGFPDMPVVDLTVQAWAQRPAFANKAAFKWVDGCCTVTDTLTYGQLDESASIIARELRERYQLAPKDMVLLVYPLGLTFLEVLFGCQRAGLVVVPCSAPNLDFFSKADSNKLLGVIRQTAPKAVLSTADYGSALQKLMLQQHADLEGLQWLFPVIPSESNVYKFKAVDEAAAVESFDHLNRYAAYSGCKAEDNYIVQYSSGATVDPRPLLVSAGATAHNARAVRNALNMSPSSTLVYWLPLYHDAGLLLSYATIVSGATAVMTSPFTFARRPVLWLEMMSNFRATVSPVPLFCLPLAVDKFERSRRAGKHSPLDLSRLQALTLFNEPMFSDVIADFISYFGKYGLDPRVLGPSYGGAENCSFVSTVWGPWNPEVQPNGVQWIADGGIAAAGRLNCDSTFEGSTGDIRIVDPITHLEMPEGEEGEIWVSSASNASGYLGNSALTASNFNVELSSQPNRKYMRTEDLGKAVNGYLFVTGRRADVMYVDGRTLHPQHIELAGFQSSPFLRPGCAVAFSTIAGEEGRGSSHRNDVIVLAELRDPTKSYPADLLQTIQSSILLQHGVNVSLIGLLKPKTVVKTTSGKLRRQAIRKLFLAGKLNCIDYLQYISSAGTTCISHEDRTPLLELVHKFLEKSKL